MQRTEVESQNFRPASSETPPSENRSSPVPRPRVPHSGVLPDVLPPQVPPKAGSVAPDFAVMERGAELVPPHAQHANQPEINFMVVFTCFFYVPYVMILRICLTSECMIPY